MGQPLRVSRRHRARFWAALVVGGTLAAASARAWPVDVAVTLRPGETWLQKLSALQLVDVETAGREVVQAEILPAGELLLTAAKPGAALILLYAEGRMAVWRVRVLEKDAAAPEKSALEVSSLGKTLGKACPHVEATASQEGAGLKAVVATEACRQRLLTLFQTDAVLARHTELTFEVPALQAQLQSITEGLAKAGLSSVKARYLGAGLVLEGVVSASEHRRVLWEIFSRTAGRVVLDDRLLLPPVEGQRDAPL